MREKDLRCRTRVTPARSPRPFSACTYTQAALENIGRIITHIFVEYELQYACDAFYMDAPRVVNSSPLRALLVLLCAQLRCRMDIEHFERVRSEIGTYSLVWQVYSTSVCMRSEAWRRRACNSLRRFPARLPPPAVHARRHRLSIFSWGT